MDLPGEERRQIAESFGVDPELVSHLPELLADVQALGGWPETIVDVLRPVAQGARVLDLGCGKGDVAIPLARELGCRVHGIDLFPPFVEEARTRAEEEGVADLCRFQVGDLRAMLEQLEGHDVAIMAAVGASVLGGFMGSVVQCGGASAPAATW